MIDTELREWFEKHTEIRPYSIRSRIDGRRNFIHRTVVAELIYKLRQNRIKVDISTESMSEERASLLAKFLAAE